MYYNVSYDKVYSKIIYIVNIVLDYSIMYVIYILD